MVKAMLFIARTDLQWRYLPAKYSPWPAVWQQWRRWRDNGVWALAMTRLAHHIRLRKNRASDPTMVMIDGQTVRGGRAGPTFHNAGGRGGRTIGAKGSSGFTPLDRVENAFARLGRWRRLSRCYEGCEKSAKAWLEVAAVAYMFALMHAEPS
jgi:transposase